MHQSPVDVERDMSWHLAVRNRIRGLLKLQHLKVDAFALVRHDEERIQGTLGTASLLGVALPGHGIALQTGFDVHLMVRARLIRLKIIHY